MPKVLVLFFHPALEKSRINRALIENLDPNINICFRDVYDLYPDFYIDVQREQELLLLHDIIIWHHPFYWYSVPPLMKQWIDLVLEHGWAYGRTGKFLQGKQLISFITAGGSQEAYQQGGYNQHSIDDFLLPLAQTARLCQMQYHNPIVIHGTHTLSHQHTPALRSLYQQLLNDLSQTEADIPALLMHYKAEFLQSTRTLSN